LDKGATAYFGAADDLNLSGQAAEDFAIFNGTSWQAKGGIEKINGGYFLRTLSLGSGTQAVTGVGFKPSVVQFYSMTQVSTAGGWGWDTLSARSCMTAEFDLTRFNATSVDSIRLQDNTTGYDIGAKITSLDSDGFTITWSLYAGTGAGTGYIIFTAFR
jgi:hypothetical protein